MPPEIETVDLDKEFIVSLARTLHVVIVDAYKEEYAKGHVSRAVVYGIMNAVGHVCGTIISGAGAHDEQLLAFLNRAITDAIDQAREKYDDEPGEPP